MTGKPEQPVASRAPLHPAVPTRADRQKAGLKANMARRKAQARARSAEDKKTEVEPLNDCDTTDDQAGGDRRNTSE